MRNLLRVALLLLAAAVCRASITSQTDQSPPYTVLGVPSTVPVPFPFQLASDLTVYDLGSVTTPRSPAALLTLGSDYTVTGGGYNSATQMQVGSILVSNIGTHLVIPNDQIVIMRGVPINQITSFGATGSLTITLIEQALDKQATVSQQVNQAAASALHFEPQEQLATLLSKAARTNSIQAYDANGQVEFLPIATVTTPTDFSNDLVTATSSTTARTLGNRFANYCNVRDYGAKGDGVTDDTTSVQAAIASAVTNKVPVYFPSGNYYVGKLTWPGVSLFGDGVGVSIITGKVGTDVFYVPDPSISEAGSTNNWPTDVDVHDLTVTVDNSTTVTNATRVAWPLSGTWASTTAIATNTFYKTGTNAVFFALVGGTTASVAPTSTTTITTDGTVQWYYVATNQSTYGNAAFAFPLANGADVSANFITRIKFKSVYVAVSGSGGNAVAWYFQRPPYAAFFQKCVARFTTYGWIGSPPSSNFSSYTWSSDTSQWQDCDCFTTVPFRWFDGANCTMTNFNVYASTTGQTSLELWPMVSPGESLPLNWNLTGYYCEPNSSTTGRLSLIGGLNHTFTSCLMKTDTGAETVDIIASGCTFTSSSIGNNNSTTALNLYGNNNLFTNTHFTNLYGLNLNTQLVNDQGTGNQVNIGKVDSTPFETERLVLTETGARLPSGTLSDSFLLTGAVSTPFWDILFGGRELLPNWNGTVGFNVADSTLETGGYLRAVNGNMFYTTSACRLPLAIGTRIPATKVRMYVKARANTTGTLAYTIYSLTPTTSQASGNISLTSSWTVFPIDMDLSAVSGDILQPTFNNVSGVTSVDIAWIAIVPYAPNQLAQKVTFYPQNQILTGTGSPQGAVAAPVGSLFLRTDGGSSTTLYVKETGTNTNSGWVAK